MDILWQAGDRIGLVDADGVITSATLEDDSAGKSEGVFAYYAGAPVEPVYAYYPYTGNETLRGTTLTLSLPAVQPIAAEGMMTASGLLPMTASHIAQDGLQFRPACAIAAFQLTGPESRLNAMSLTQSGFALSGKGTMDLSAASPVFTPTAQPTNVSVALSSLALSPSKPVTAYAVLPQGTLDDLNLSFAGTLPDGTTPVSYGYVKTSNVFMEAGHVTALSLALEAQKTTLYGKVLCEGLPVANVVVSDGHQVSLTDATGTWKLSSDKKEGLVFLSIPSGYTVDRRYGAIPAFWQHTARAADEPERIDFHLIRQEGQQKHRLYLLGDMHGMQSNNAGEQYARFAADLNAQAGEVTCPQVAVQLGDSTWDYLWYDKYHPFRMNDYLGWSNLVDMLSFNTMGNHDGDMYVTDDWLYGADFRQNYGPTYYSFNMGSVHYVVLDNVLTCNDGSGIEGRDYHFGLTETQLSWLNADLSHVAKTTPIVVLYHIPMLDRKGAPSHSGSMDMSLADFTAPFASFDNVRYYAAHTHNLYSASATVSGKTIREQNVSAVCADFWGSGRIDARSLICRDGCPTGYRILDVDGTTFKDVFKVTGRPNYLFRAYDRNSIKISADEWVPDAGLNHRQSFIDQLGEFKNASSANYVYIYTWDWKDDWSISVTENGVALSTSVISETDPLYMISSTMVDRCNKPDSGSYTLDMYPTPVTKVFRVKASSSNSAVVIKMTDSYGNSRTEVMRRPKAFNREVYASEGFPTEAGQHITSKFSCDEEMDL